MKLAENGDRLNGAFGQPPGKPLISNSGALNKPGSKPEKGEKGELKKVSGLRSVDNPGRAVVCLGS